MSDGITKESKGDILIVDDNFENLKLITSVLENANYTVRAVTDGNTALTMAQNAPPELILLDILMPNINGYDLCNYLKQTEITKDIPIVFLSVLNGMSDKIEALNAGGIDYISKPFNCEEILARVKTYVKIRKLQLKLESQNDNLEEKVRKRTTRLEAEIEERKKIEKELINYKVHLENMVIEQTEEIIIAKEDAEKANKAKSQFLSSMSHELRTPLNSIIGYSQILKTDIDSQKKILKGLNIINKSGNHLLEIINEILDLSKIEAGKLDFIPVSLNLNLFLKYIVDVINERVLEKGINFSYKIIPENDLIIQTDETRLRQILLNLLGNAIKFTDKGNVFLRIFYVKKESFASLKFEIMDTGIGISEDKIKKIFLPFEQVCDLKHRKKGTGLGLTISKRLVEFMGGQLNVESKVGKGTTFWFELDMPIAKNENIKKINLENITGYYLNEDKGLKILIADDIVDNRQILFDLLSSLGFIIYEAENGLQTLIKAKEKKPDLIIVDLKMPEMTGLEATRLIRKETCLKHTKIFCISASAFEKDRQDSKDAGCDEFLPKPIIVDELLYLIKKYFSINWTYDNNNNDEKSQKQMSYEMEDSLNELIIPPQNIINTFYHYTKSGDVLNLKRLSKELIKSDYKYKKFCEVLLYHCSNYNLKELKRFIKTYV